MSDNDTPAAAVPITDHIAAEFRRLATDPGNVLAYGKDEARTVALAVMLRTARGFSSDAELGVITRRLLNELADLRGDEVTP